MDRPIDLERLSAVLTDHPWLAEALSNGAWWGRCDGSVEVVAPIEDPIAVREALGALAEALGCRAEDVRARGDMPDTAAPAARSARRRGP